MKANVLSVLLWFGADEQWKLPTVLGGVNGDLEWFLTVGRSEQHGSRVRRGEKEGCPSWTQWFLNRRMGDGVADEGTTVDRGFDVRTKETRARRPCGGKMAHRKSPCICGAGNGGRDSCCEFGTSGGVTIARSHGECRGLTENPS